MPRPFIWSKAAVRPKLGAGILPPLASRLPHLVRQLERDLPELLAFFAFPKHLWRKLRTTNIIERCFVEVRRRTRPMVCFVNVRSVDRIIYSSFQRFNLEWKNRTLRGVTQAA
jgi:transposase-like protein